MSRNPDLLISDAAVKEASNAMLGLLVDHPAMKATLKAGIRAFLHSEGFEVQHHSGLPGSETDRTRLVGPWKGKL